MQKGYTIIVVGAGGIGTHLMPMLIRSLIPTSDYIVEKFIVVDGDTYERKNLARQQFTELAIGRNKAEVQAEKIRMLMRPIVPGVEKIVEAFPHYITEANLPMLLRGITNDIIIFSGVDNHPCRLLLSRFTERNKDRNILLFTGGNNRMDGSVHCQGKWQGVEFDEPIENRHPEILTDTTDDRAEMSCQELHNLAGGEQTIAANAMAAAIMYAWFVSILENPTKTNDIEDFYYDLSTMNVRSIRPVKTLSVKEK